MDNVVAVASIDRLDNRSSFSSYGATTVDLGAPGSSILSTTRNGTYSTFSGTSMATPHVAGALVVLLDANPGLTYRQAIDRILQTVRPVAALSGKTVTGGVLNLEAALAGGLPPLPPPPPPPLPPPSDRQTFTSTTSPAIPDRQTINVPISVPVALTIADIDVKVNISHTYDRDLRLYLLAPDGRQITLANRVGGSGNNFTDTTFDDEATVSIRNGSAPFSGTFRPEGLLSSFDGMAANGSWRLRVSDLARGDVGTVNSVTLSILFNDGGPWVHTFGIADETTSAVTPLATDFAPVQDVEAGLPASSGVILSRRAVGAEPVEPVAVAGPAVSSAPMRGIAWPSSSTADPFDDLADDFAPVEV